MPVICPSILAATAEDYRQQIEKVGRFARRIQIDLTDGQFAKNQTISPEDAWWPVGIKADFHLMFGQPDKAVQTVLQHKPHMVIIHAESRGNFASFSHICHQHGVKIGVALLPRTPVESILTALPLIDHVLIFSGDLGSFGGTANLDLLARAAQLKHHKPDLEVGWDGGVNNQNISRLATGGVDVFNVGGYLQNSPNPEHDYKVLERIAEETGTT